MRVRADPGEVDVGVGHVVDVVGQHVQRHVQHDLDRLGVAEAGGGQGGDVGVQHAATLGCNTLGKAQCGVVAGVGGAAVAGLRNLVVGELDEVLADVAVRGQAVVAAVELGLGAQRVAAAITGMPAGCVPALHHAIGHYYTLSASSPFRHLVYPSARDGKLRAHVTLDLGGRCKFGPDLSWRDGVDYRFDTTREADFYTAVRRYWPKLKDGELQPGYTGIRPRLTGPGSSLHNTANDFVVQGAEAHGLRGWVNLFGIESPGLTASLALAEHVVALLRRCQ